MLSITRLQVVAVCMLLCTSGMSDELSFNRDIRPILSDTCFFCHGPDSAHREADLRLDVEEQAKDYAIIAGDHEASEFYARITSEDEDLLMPPNESGKKLSAEQISLIKKWIDQGAPYEPYWAYVKPKSSPIPNSESDWPADAADEFIVQKLSDEKLVPSPETDPSSLVRRLSYDLTGLPPSPHDVTAFISDPNPSAYRRLVDRLLASPAFGERMAVYWLDLVRFADTVGYHGDQDHNVSPYRDYVIDAFNADMPLDQFTREQLAGDLFSEPTESQKIATCYNRLLQTSHEGGVQPKEYLAIYAADRIRNVSAVWMGATVGCAQCHDHKYDPYSIDDFYRMSAFFADIDEEKHFTNGSNALPTKRDPEISVLSGWQREWLAEVEAKIENLEQSETSNASELSQLKALRARLNESRRMTMITKTVKPRQVRVLPRGDWLDDSGPVVQPAIPEFLGSIDIDGQRANRMDLANWLVDPENGSGGLTARVFVNRFWYLLFGRGLSTSLADFGGQGSPPTHPELLDQLSIDFMEDGWSVKRLMRRLVLTKAYRQSSDTIPKDLRIDPLNQWFARQSRYRLPAEMVRDQALSFGGMLVRDVGGASVKPHQPAGYYRHLNFPKRVYVPDRSAKLYRRGVYVHWQRQFLHPMLKAMDAPTREECTAKRPRSNTPLEALVMLNDPSMVEASISLASRILHSSHDRDVDGITQGFLWTVARKPEPAELLVFETLLRSETDHYANHPAEAQALLASADKYVRVDSEPQSLAAWTAVARAMMNMYETVTRN